MVEILHRILSRVRSCASAVWRKLAPFAEVPPTLVDAVRSRRELLVENALLRHQIVVLRRRVPRPRLTPVDRLRLLLAACLLPGWRRAVALVQPQTILRWHRLGFRLFWRHKSKSCPRDQVTSDTVWLIREMAARNRLWGAERIRGELLKIGVRVSKRTIQKYMRSCRRKPGGQTWSMFIKNHAQDILVLRFRPELRPPFPPGLPLLRRPPRLPTGRPHGHYTRSVPGLDRPADPQRHHGRRRAEVPDPGS
jgi:hypothetical protein